MDNELDNYAARLHASLGLDRVADTPEELRARRKLELAAAYRLFGRWGFSEGVAGHISVRDPLRPDAFWTARYAMHHRLVKVSNLLLVKNDGSEVLVGEGPVHPAAITIHGGLLDLRPELVSVAHAHSDYGRVLSATGGEIEMLTQDACVFFEAVSYLDEYGGPAVETRECENISQALGDGSAVILGNHGLLTVGTSAAECAWKFFLLEKVCKVQAVANASGLPRTTLPIDVVKKTAATIGSTEAAEMAFHSELGWICTAEPDLAE